MQSRYRIVSALAATPPTVRRLVACNLPDGTRVRYRTDHPVTHAVCARGIDSEVWFVRAWTCRPDESMIEASDYFQVGVRLELVRVEELARWTVSP